MTYDATGHLYVCEHVTSSVVMETTDGVRTLLATHWQGKELNSPNDVVVRSDGACTSPIRRMGACPCSDSSGSRIWTSRARTDWRPTARSTGSRDQPAERPSRREDAVRDDTTRAHIRHRVPDGARATACSRRSSAIREASDVVRRRNVYARSRDRVSATRRPGRHPDAGCRNLNGGPTCA